MKKRGIRYILTNPKIGRVVLDRNPLFAGGMSVWEGSGIYSWPPVDPLRHFRNRFERVT